MPTRRIIWITSTIGALIIVFGIPYSGIILFFVVPAALAIFAVIACISAILFVEALFNHKATMAIIELAISASLATLSALAFVFPRFAVQSIEIPARYIELGLSQPAFQKRIASCQQAESCLIILETGGFLSSGSGIVYDPSRQIEQTPGTQPEAWIKLASNTPLESKCWSAIHLVGAYYSWSGDYSCD